jgi:hypothetical protein
LAKTWVRIASSVQSRGEAHSRINGRPPGDCTLEAMRTQASPGLCAGFKWLIAFDFNLHSLHIKSSKEVQC